MAHTIVYKNPKDLIPYVSNARIHNDEQITKIAASIKEFKFNNPVLIDGTNGIVCGHGRTLAAIKLGLEQVPCIVLDHLTDAQRRSYILADNRLSLDEGAYWDKDLLKLELAKLTEMNFDLTMTAFNLDEITNMFDQPLPKVEENMPAPQQSETCPECGNKIKPNGG